MLKRKMKFFKIKIGIISFLIFVLISFCLGFFLNYFFVYQNSQKADLSKFYKVWEILDKDFLDTNTEKEEKEDEDIKKDRIWGATAGLVASFEDPYTVFLPPQQSKDLQDDISGEFSGIGVEIDNRDGFLTVVSPLPGMPASNAGILPKDIIAKVGDIDTLNFSPSDAAKIIKGEPGTEVVLSILRKGEAKLLEIVVERALIKIPVVKTYSKDGVFVIKLFSFTQNSPELFHKALEKFVASKNTKLIVDLRGNPGGHLFAAVYIAGLFLPENTEIITEDYGEKKESHVLRSGDFHKTKKNINIFTSALKIGILVDEGSASASEILAGSLNENNRAILLGKNTYGKGTVQSLLDFSDGTSLKYTIAKWILPNGNWISEKGIAVDIEIDISPEEIKKARENGSFTDNIDPQLQRAINQMQKFKTQKDIKNLIKKNREKRMLENAKQREEKIKKILDN